MHYMYSCLVLVAVVVLPSSLFGQCDTSTGEFAVTGSYEVHYNPEKSENRVAPQQLANCDHLAQIEAARADEKDVILEIDNYIIVVTSRKRLTQIELENQAK